MTQTSSQEEARERLAALQKELAEARATYSALPEPEEAEDDYAEEEEEDYGSVTLYAGSYTWLCPKCETANNEDYYASEVGCYHCELTVAVDGREFND